QVATACMLGLRETDAIGRLGGEEFLLLLSYTEVSEGIQIAERLRRSVSRLTLRPIEKNATVTISIGLTDITRADSVTDCYERADRALYNAKSTGRNRVFFMSSTP